MGGSKQLEAFLFNKLKIVGLGPGDRVKLLDLLVRTKSAWGTRLANLGPFHRYRLDPSDPHSVFQDPDGDFTDYLERFQEGFELLEDDPCRTDMADEQGTFTARTVFVKHDESISSASTLAAKILHLFTGKISTSNDLHCTIVHPCYHEVTDVVQHDIFVREEEESPLWNPDLTKIKRCSDIKVKRDGTIEMWIVTAMVYCDEFRIGGAHYTSAQVGLAVDGQNQVGVQAGGNSSARTNTFGRHKLGFKAIRLFYDSQGKLKQWRRQDMGNSHPKLRTSESLRDPTYHMGGLFLEPPVDGEEALSLQCLDIENVELD
eukprot:TRINITY_DN5545_c0_g6_i1.p1 TRINITY_DN5545_c0_g6~~TRINITY_DN5545_c0_g6_i1.p1  ORF type:complete len:317 (+),score=39.45 TRINITY_DN5545_c0_g6_i1:124-1074(+)